MHFSFFSEAIPNLASSWETGEKGDDDSLSFGTLLLPNKKGIFTNGSPI